MLRRSLSDVEAAHAAGAAAIGHANQHGKRETIAPLEPSAIIEHMTELADGVAATHR